MVCGALEEGDEVEAELDVAGWSIPLVRPPKSPPPEVVGDFLERASQLRVFGNET